MTKEIKSKAVIKDGKMKIIRRQDFDQFVKLAPSGDYQLTLKKIYRKRSIHQNAFYWGVFLDMEMSVLYDEGWHFPNKDLLHEWNKSNFLKDKIVNEDTGEVFDVVKPSSGLTTTEWEEFMENIRLTFRDNYGCELPYPVNEFTDD
jgi:hypothetical protein